MTLAEHIIESMLAKARETGKAVRCARPDNLAFTTLRHTSYRVFRREDLREAYILREISPGELELSTKNSFDELPLSTSNRESPLRSPGPISHASPAHSTSSGELIISVHSPEIMNALSVLMKAEIIMSATLPNLTAEDLRTMYPRQTQELVLKDTPNGVQLI